MFIQTDFSVKNFESKAVVLNNLQNTKEQQMKYVNLLKCKICRPNCRKWLIIWVAVTLSTEFCWNVPHSIFLSASCFSVLSFQKIIYVYVCGGAAMLSRSLITLCFCWGSSFLKFSSFGPDFFLFFFLISRFLRLKFFIFFLSFWRSEAAGTSVRRSSGRCSAVAVRAVDCWQWRSGH